MTTRTPLTLDTLLARLTPSDRMPVAFIGHGNPMNALDDNGWTRGWERFGDGLPRPQAVLCISAHWHSRGETLVQVSGKPPTVHDFRGFPDNLHAFRYPAPGAPALAREVAAMVADHGGTGTGEWGLDHGAWAVLHHIWPDADMPVFQLSIDMTRPFTDHAALGARLAALRERGVLVIGSGNIVHNLREMRMGAAATDWALEADATFAAAITDRDTGALTGVDRAGALFRQAHPTPDHFIPALFVMGMAGPKDDLAFFNEGIDLGTVSMRSFVFG